MSQALLSTRRNAHYLACIYSVLKMIIYKFLFIYPTPESFYLIDHVYSFQQATHLENCVWRKQTHFYVLASFTMHFTVLKPGKSVVTASFWVFRHQSPSCSNVVREIGWKGEIILFFVPPPSPPAKYHLCLE